MECYIELKGVRFFAYHGVLPQERIVGNNYEIDLVVGYPFEKALHSDDLEQTLSYADLYDSLKREMAQPTALLEHVAGRITDALITDYPLIHSIDLRIIKLNPPISGDVPRAAVHIKIADTLAYIKEFF